jgi:hypothetical protein
MQKATCRAIHSHAGEAAKGANIGIEYLGCSTTRKEATVQEKLLKQGMCPAWPASCRMLKAAAGIWRIISRIGTTPGLK